MGCPRRLEIQRIKQDIIYLVHSGFLLSSFTLLMCMKNRSLLLFSVVATIVVYGNNPSSTACPLLDQRLTGLVYFPSGYSSVLPLTQLTDTDSTEFVADISHFDSTSTQNATCSVEPSSVDHVSTILSPYVILSKQATTTQLKISRAG